MKLLDDLHDRGGRALLQAIDQPPVEFRSPLDVFQCRSNYLCRPS